MAALPVLFQLAGDAFRVMAAGVGGIRGAIGQPSSAGQILFTAAKQVGVNTFKTGKTTVALAGNTASYVSNSNILFARINLNAVGTAVGFAGTVFTLIGGLIRYIIVGIFVTLIVKFLLVRVRGIGQNLEQETNRWKLNEANAATIEARANVLTPFIATVYTYTGNFLHVIFIECTARFISSLFVWFWTYLLLWFISFVFLLMEQNSAYALNVMSITSNAAVQSMNVGSSIVNLGLHVLNVFLPFYNQQAKAAYLTFSAIVTALIPQTKTAPNAPNYGRRVLQDAEFFDYEQYDDVIRVVVGVTAFLSDIYLQFQLVVLKIFLSIFRFLTAGILQYAAFLVLRIFCMISGIFCLIPEFFATLIPLFFGGGRCSASTLTFLLVPCVCQGNLFDWSGSVPGIFANSECEASRRALRTCHRDEEGFFIESYNGQDIDRAYLELDSCPGIRNVLNSTKNAYQKLIYHEEDECEHVCLHDVYLEICHSFINEHDILFKGRCNVGQHIDEQIALDLVKSYTGNGMLEFTKQRRKTTSTTNDIYTRNQLIQQLIQFTTPSIYTINIYGTVIECDLTQTSNITARSLFVDLACMYAKYGESLSKHHITHRELKQEEYSHTRYVNEQWLGPSIIGLHNRLRLLKTLPNDIDPIHGLDILTETEYAPNTWAHGQIASIQMANAYRHAVAQYHEEEEIHARRLTDLSDPFGGCYKYLCANMEQCVEFNNKKECNGLGEDAGIGQVIQRSMEVFDVYFFSFADMGGLLKKIRQCWAGYNNPAIDPTSPKNLISGVPCTTCTYCIPMVSPFNYRIQRSTFNFRQYVLDACNSNSTYSECRCDYYYYTAFNYEDTDFSSITYSVTSRLINGAIAIQFLSWYGIFQFTFIGTVWYTLMVSISPGTPHWLRYMFLNQHPEISITNQLACSIVHLGSLAYFLSVALTFYILIDALWPIIRELSLLVTRFNFGPSVTRIRKNVGSVFN
jgi:hypothetical protein